jgi:HSP20 family protein
MIWLYDKKRNLEQFGRLAFGGNWIKADVIENDKEYVIEAELAGVAMDQISIELEQDVLRLEVSELKNTNDVNGNLIKQERSTVARKRSWALPKDANSEAIKASQNNGLLTISIQKKEEVKAKKIKIKAA